MLWLALIAGLYRTLRVSKKTGIKSEEIVDIAFYALIAGVLFAHIVSLLLDIHVYWHNPGAILDLWRGMLSPSGGLRGLSFHGGLIGATGMVLLYTRKKKIKFLVVADLLSPGLAIGYAVARIGCFLNGCCYGVPTTLPWGVRFHLDSTSSLTTVPSQPTQIYSSMASIGIFFILVWLEKRKRFTGQVFYSYLAIYSIYRFLIEYLRRGVTAQVLYAGLTEAQFASIAILALAIMLLWWGGKSEKECA